MKTFSLGLTLGLILILSPFSHAQTQLGYWTVGTQIGNFSYQNQNGSRFLSANVTPSVGYFVENGLAVGLGIPLNVSNQKNTDDNSYYGFEYRSSTLGLSPFLRYYLGQSKLKPYVGLAYTFSWLRQKNTRTDMNGLTSSEGTGTSAALVPTVGLAYFISPTVGLTGGLNYTISHLEQETTSLVGGTSPITSSYKADSKVLSLAVGFQLFFGK